MVNSTDIHKKFHSTGRQSFYSTNNQMEINKANGNPQFFDHSRLQNALAHSEKSEFE